MVYYLRACSRRCPGDRSEGEYTYRRRRYGRWPRTPGDGTMLQSKPARATGLLGGALALALLLTAGLALLIWPPGPAEAQEKDEEPTPVSNLKCVASEDRIRFSWDIPSWSGGELKWYAVDVTLPNGNRFTQWRHWTLRSRTDRGNWEPGKEARMGVKAIYEVAGEGRVFSAETVETCVVPGEPPAPNNAPTVASVIADATIVKESGTHEASLSGVFNDADGDDLTITATSSDEKAATVSVAADYSKVTVTAKARGTTTVTVTAADGKGGTVSDEFSVKVKASPAVASAISDVSGLEVDDARKISLSGVFTDADGDSLTVTAASSKDAVAAVVVATDQSALTLTGKSEGTATVTVTAEDSDGNSVSDAFDVTVVAKQPVNNPPTVSSAIADATITNESGTHEASLSGVFSDADQDSLTVTATSSAETVATVSVAADYAKLTVTAKARGTATVTVTAADGKGGSVEDTFTVTVKATPVVASALADIMGLNVKDTRTPSLAGVFSDADGDAIAVTQVQSSDTSKVSILAAVSTAADGSISITGFTLTAEDAGTASITVTAQDSDGNRVNDAFDVTVVTATLPQQALSSDATLSAIAVYRATSFQPDSADNVGYTGSALTLTPAVSAQGREYHAEIPEAGGEYVTVVVTPTASAAKSIVVSGPESPREARPPKGKVSGGEASGPWYLAVGYTLVTVEVTSLDGENTETYRLILKRGTVDAPKGLRLTGGDQSLTLHWDANAAATAPNYYQFRWRKSGETAWLNPATFSGRRTSYAADAPYGTAADGGPLRAASTGNKTVSGLENGVEYEVQARSVRHVSLDHQVMNWLASDWHSLTGTAGEAPAALTTLTITPSAPTRTYGEADDLSYTVSGLVEGDGTASVVTGALSRATGEDVGEYAIGMGTLAIASTYASKYALPAAPAVTTYRITPRAITAISGVTVVSRASDGTTTASFDTGSAAGTGVLAAELADFRAGGLVVTGVFPAATPGTHDVSVTYSLQDHGAFKAANYSLSATTDTLPGELTAVTACAAGLTLAVDRLPAEGGNPVTVIFALSQPAGPEGATVSLTTGGTATSGVDYTLSAATAVIPPGVAGGTATITVIDDTIDDDDETIILNAAVASSSLTAGPLTLTIADNDDGAITPVVTPVANAPCTRPANGDYDADDDGLIEVCNMAQLRAIDWDPNGDGTRLGGTGIGGPSKALYSTAFAGAVSGMGCPQTGCIGYELTTDLDFDRNGNGRADWRDGYLYRDGRRYHAWIGIGTWGEGSREEGFTAIFEGNGHVIKHLYLEGVSFNGLFSRTGRAAVIRNLGVEDALMNGDGHHVGGLVGHNGGTIINSYTTGSIRGSNGVGGLVGGSDSTSRIIGSYSTANVTGSDDDVGGLVGGNEGAIIASYATGSVTGTGEADGNYRPAGPSGSGHAIGGLVGLNYPYRKIVASYATGTVTAAKGWKVGGLVGFNLGSVTASYSTGKVSGAAELSGLAHTDPLWYSSPTARHSYWDTVTSGTSTSAHGVGKTTAELQAPTGYAGIFANWNVDVDGNGNSDDPWDFGNSCQYPTLKYGSLNPDDQRPACTPANQTASGTRVNIVATYDPTAEGYDDAAVHSLSQPQSVTMEPEFRSEVHSYRLTVPADMDRLTFAGNFNRGIKSRVSESFAVLVVGDLEIYESLVLPAMYRDDSELSEAMIIANADPAARGTHTIALPPGATTVIKIGVYKTRAGHAYDLANRVTGWSERKTVYTLTVTRGNPGADDGSTIADVNGLKAGSTRDISLTEVFDDVDGESLTVTAESSAETVATVSVATDGSKLTLTGVSEGTATIMVTARDSSVSGGIAAYVSDAFEVAVTAPAATPTDYDGDDDGLIEVSSLAQLNALRWDLDGDGSASNSGYAAAFPNAASGMGCPSAGCLGYELVADLDFDTNASGQADAGDDYWNGGTGWTPIGLGSAGFAAVFDGNGRAIGNLFIDAGDSDVGLFSKVAGGGAVRNVRLEDVSVTSSGGRVGGLAGSNAGAVGGVRVSGSVTGRNAVGGLVGKTTRTGVVTGSHSTVAVSGTHAIGEGGRDVGGLVGYNQGNIRASSAVGSASGKAENTGGLVGYHLPTGVITASYARSVVSSSGSYVGGLVGSHWGTVTASYAAGDVTGGTAVGGLVGYHGGAVSDGYWDTEVSQAGATAGAVGGSAGASGEGKTTAELQTPTDYVGIYANWNVDLDGDGNADDPWDFGTASQYPALK